MTQTTERLTLTTFEARLAADELLFELRRGDWRPLRPELLLEPPAWEMPGSVPTPTPQYLTALLPTNPFLQNLPLEIAIMQTDYQDALHEIDGLGYGELWREFLYSKAQLYWIERRGGTVIKRDDMGKVAGALQTENIMVRQNRRTGPEHRRAMSCIWRRAVVREHVAVVHPDVL